GYVLLSELCFYPLLARVSRVLKGAQPGTESASRCDPTEAACVSGRDVPDGGGSVERFVIAAVKGCSLAWNIDPNGITTLHQREGDGGKEMEDERGRDDEGFHPALVISQKLISVEGYQPVRHSVPPSARPFDCRKTE
ncbi:Protein-L-isoaspartate O-methyltransferase, partial [Dissostichus eleginoides]